MRVIKLIAIQDLAIIYFFPDFLYEHFPEKIYTAICNSRILIRLQENIVAKQDKSVLRNYLERFLHQYFQR